MTSAEQDRAEPRQDPQREREEQQKRLTQRMAAIRHKVAVLSGKGGVGKSTVAANLAVALAGEGFRVGLLDVDVHGPSIPKLLGLEEAQVFSDGQDIVPAAHGPNLRVMSIAFLMRDVDEAVIWRGPLKMSFLRQVLADVEWGELDFLILDLPPGTGDEPLSVCQLIPDAAGAIVVTTPQDLSVSDVRRCVTFCRRLKLPVLGVLENMSGFVCPHCGKEVEIFGEGGGRRMAESMGVPLLGRVPIDPDVVRVSDGGEPFVESRPESPATRAFLDAIEPIARLARQESAEEKT